MKIKQCYDGRTCANEALIEELESRLTAADALAEFVELIASRLEKALDAGDISGRRLASAAVKDLNAALREYREVEG